MHESADPEWTDAGGRCPDSNKENAKTRKRNRKTCGSSNSRKLTKKAGGDGGGGRGRGRGSRGGKTQATNLIPCMDEWGLKEGEVRLN